MAKVFARNKTTGQVTRVPEHYLTHPVFGKQFEPASKNDKNYLPEMYKPPVDNEPKKGKFRTEKKNEETLVETETITNEGGE